MAVTTLRGFEAQDTLMDGIVFGGASAGYSTAQARTGVASVRCHPASGGSGYMTGYSGNGATKGAFVHFGMYVATNPSLDRLVAGTISAGTINLRLTSAGALGVYLNTTLIGTSSAAFASPGWHWVGMRHLTGTSVSFLQIDGVDEVSGTATVTTIDDTLGLSGTEASAVDLYIDDVIEDGAGFLAPSNVGMLVATADSAVGTGWTNDAAGTSSLFDAVDNKPPVGIADTTASTGLHQIRNATSNANVNYDATMTTYTAAGAGAGATVLAVQPVVATAAPVTTSSKQGTFGVVSNPAISNVALGSVGTAGAFWSGLAAGTYNSGWKQSFGAVATSPTVTLGTAPVMRVTQVTASTRIAMVCFMGIVVAWTPAVASNPPYVSPYPQLLPQ